MRAAAKRALAEGSSEAPPGSTPLDASLPVSRSDRERPCHSAQAGEEEVLAEFHEREVGDDHQHEHGEEVERERREPEYVGER